ncbi:non-ribosomal peptide synthetase [Geodermatophilus obscurus]|uniref:AMP-dependent synthetase and ligase n=1 Tax=Geodermatophilus obscurus (strain ATCC 25078 / DSM 43160 / JCM 3152 / CCUG 61914 / KCC A-0152 / KCTC 9177 / NBRC 13315 / NRRL B-3577 / G-20) TaxID=526225 RepID=D2S5Z8_GEOOG|nr:non-ribosomal peptide synthetase [Geodermatophilus obscurus]ADB73215.1 AMP-dependent synthetase and ligase [Geodermatophilus obscurus DSM 43160]
MSAATTSEGVPPLVMPGPYTSVAERLREVSDHLADRPAVVAADGDLTYRELQQHVDAVVRALAALPVVDGDGTRQPIGLLAEQGSASVVAMLGIMAAGHPCVLLDVLLPPARLGVVTERAGVTVVLADDERRDVAAGLPGVGTVADLVPSDDATSDIPAPAITLDDPASLVFTSGSTGLPKGVVWTQRTSLAIGHTSRVTLRATPEDRMALVVPQAFAVGQLMILAALLNGATLCVRDPRIHGIRDLAEWLDATRVTILSCTPSLLRAIHGALPEGHVLETVRMVTTAGEKVYGNDVTDFRTHLRLGASFLNWMGSSETEALTGFEIRPEDPVPDGAVPIGRAVPLRDLAILGPDEEPVPAGEVGVLYATSAYFSAGYWRDPAATAVRFRAEPDGRTRYCTGDRARMSADGLVEILGRADDSVKIRGYLVEPGEVEVALRALPAVVDAVVRGVGVDDETRLVAWVVPDPHRPRPTEAALRSDVGRALPDWMVPRDVVFLPELPRNERGKVDVGALPPPPERRETAAPETETEVALAGIWEPILKTEGIGREDSFTALGGESLAIEEMLAAVEQQYRLRLAADDLIDHPTLAEFAAFVDSRRSSGLAGRLAAVTPRLEAAGKAVGGLLRGRNRRS